MSRPPGGTGNGSAGFDGEGTSNSGCKSIFGGVSAGAVRSASSIGRCVVERCPLPLLPGLPGSSMLGDSMLGELGLLSLAGGVERGVESSGDRFGVAPLPTRDRRASPWPPPSFSTPRSLAAAGRFPLPANRRNLLVDGIRCSPIQCARSRKAAPASDGSEKQHRQSKSERASAE